MAITFDKQKQRQNYLVIVLIVSLLIAFFIWWVFLKPTNIVEPPLTSFVPATIQINFDVLKSDELNALNVFPEVPQYEDQAGRDNPFLPY